MEASKNSLERILNGAERLRFLADGAKKIEISPQEQESLNEAKKIYVSKFEEAMDDDFNTADALAAVFELVKFANTQINEESSKGYVVEVYAILKQLCDVLGLIIEKEKEVLDEDIERLIAERQAARKMKNFAKADEIRDQLTNMGIILEDTREGVKWKRA